MIVLDEQLLTVEETAALLRVSRATIYRLLNTNQIRGAFRISGTGNWRINRNQLSEWIVTTTRNGGAKLA